jgi:glycosyltransferase involved in cell wall biosynthesis
VADRFDLGWHPNGRHVREEELGLTPARLRGFSEAVADLIVFVDDDNLLDPDYLEEALRIAREYPFLGTWGGQCVAEYEVEPAAELESYLAGLAIRTTERDLWTNLAGWSDAYPFGAGMCVRRRVMSEFCRQTTQSALRLCLGRKGRALLSGEDHEINLTACDLGLGCGVFQALKLTHLILARRVTVEYMLKMAYAHGFSNAVLLSARGKAPADPLPTATARLLWKLRLLRQPYPHRALRWAGLAGAHDGLRFCHQKEAAGAEAAPARFSERLLDRAAQQ